MTNSPPYPRLGYLNRYTTFVLKVDADQAFNVLTAALSQFPELEVKVDQARFKCTCELSYLSNVTTFVARLFTKSFSTCVLEFQRRSGDTIHYHGFLHRLYPLLHTVAEVPWGHQPFRAPMALDLEIDEGTLESFDHMVIMCQSEFIDSRLLGAHALVDSTFQQQLWRQGHPSPQYKELLEKMLGLFRTWAENRADPEHRRLGWMALANLADAGIDLHLTDNLIQEIRDASADNTPFKEFRWISKCRERMVPT